MSIERDQTVEAVRARIDIVDVVSEVVPLKRAGKNYVALCPFHDEDTPSFTVAPDKQMYYCFGCQSGGDVFAFVMQRDGCTFPEALAKLADRAGVVLPQRSLTPQQRRLLARQEKLLQALGMAADAFRRALMAPAAEPVRAYLKGRGLTGETAKAFGIGWAPDDWQVLSDKLLQAGFAPELLIAAGLAVARRDGSVYDRFRGRVMFPIRDEQGRVIAFGGRVLDAGEPKYLNSPETDVFSKRRTLYALDLARAAMRQHGYAVIVEGYLDAVSLHQAGFPMTVASLGTALSEEQVRIIARYAERIFVAYDADAAGRQATLRGLEHFTRVAPGRDVRIVSLPDGHDPDSYIRAHGAEALQKRLDAAQPLLDYVFDQFCRQQDIGRPENKVRVIAAVAPWLAREPSPLVRSHYLRRWAAALAVSEADLRAELGRWINEKRRKSQSRQGAGRLGKNEHKSQMVRYTMKAQGGRLIQQAPEPGHTRAERELVRIMLHRPDLSGTILTTLAPSDFSTPSLRAIVEAMQRTLKDDDFVTAGEAASWQHRVFDAAGDDEARTMISRLLVAGPPPGDLAQIIDDCRERLQRRRVERRAQELLASIDELERTGQPVPADWLIEYQALQEQLRGAASERG